MAQRAPNAATSRGKGSSGLLMAGLLCGGVVTMATPTALLSAVLLAPSVIVLALDTRPGRPSARPVLLCGFAAVLHPLLSLWHGGHTIAAAIALASSTTVLATAWAAQAGAWLAAELIPVSIRIVLDGQAAAHATVLRGARRKYEQGWGFPPTSDASAADDGPD